MDLDSCPPVKLVRSIAPHIVFWVFGYEAFIIATLWQAMLSIQQEAVRRGTGRKQGYR
jgi:hypothetical protein